MRYTPWRLVLRVWPSRWHARQVEQLNDAVLQDVPHPGAFPQALDEAAALAHAAVVFFQSGQQGQQPVVEAGQQVGGWSSSSPKSSQTSITGRYVQMLGPRR